MSTLVIIQKERAVCRCFVKMVIDIFSKNNDYVTLSNQKNYEIYDIFMRYILVPINIVDQRVSCLSAKMSFTPRKFIVSNDDTGSK